MIRNADFEAIDAGAGGAGGFGGGAGGGAGDGAGGAGGTSGRGSGCWVMPPTSMCLQWRSADWCVWFRRWPSGPNFATTVAIGNIAQCVTLLKVSCHCPIYA